jgi:hypothetical protein
MRKIFLTIGLAVFMAALVYIPLAATYVSVPKIPDVYAAGKAYCFANNSSRITECFSTNTSCEVKRTQVVNEGGTAGACTYQTPPATDRTIHGTEDDTSFALCVEDDECGSDMHCSNTSTDGSQGQCLPGAPGPTSTNPPSNTGPTSTNPPSNTGPTSTNPPSNTGPTSTNPPSNTGPTSTNPPSNTGPTSTNPPQNTGPTQTSSTSTNPPGNQQADGCGVTKLCSPLLSQYDTLCKVIRGIIRLITQIGALIAVLMIIWTGFKFVTAQGNPKDLQTAKDMFKTAIIGTAILLGASGIANIVVTTVFSITSQSQPGICSI